jgi:hypothetical protein
MIGEKVLMRALHDPNAGQHSSAATAMFDDLQDVSAVYSNLLVIFIAGIGRLQVHGARVCARPSFA